MFSVVCCLCCSPESQHPPEFATMMYPLQVWDSGFARSVAHFTSLPHSLLSPMHEAAFQTLGFGRPSRSSLASYGSCFLSVAGLPGRGTESSGVQAGYMMTTIHILDGYLHVLELTGTPGCVGPLWLCRSRVMASTTSFFCPKPATVATGPVSTLEAYAGLHG